MPTIDLSDEELQGLIMLCAQGSGPGITWLLTNGILAKAQAAAQASQAGEGAARVDKSGQAPLSDGLDANPPPPTINGPRSLKTR